MEICEVNASTCVLKYGSQRTKIIEGNKVYFTHFTPTDIISYSCEYFGSSLEGRICGSQKMLGMCYKLPIIIEESHELIFLPTKSINNEKCSWVNLSNVRDYYAKGKRVVVEFTNGMYCELPMSRFSFETQLFRASKLLLALQTRKNQIK